MCVIQLYSVTSTDNVVLHLCAGCSTGAFANLGYDDHTKRIFLNDMSSSYFHCSGHNLCTLTRAWLK